MSQLSTLVICFQMGTMKIIIYNSKLNSISPTGLGIYSWGYNTYSVRILKIRAFVLMIVWKLSTFWTILYLNIGLAFLPALVSNNPNFQVWTREEDQKLAKRYPQNMAERACSARRSRALAVSNPCTFPKVVRFWQKHMNLSH